MSWRADLEHNNNELDGRFSVCEKRREGPGACAHKPNGGRRASPSAAALEKRPEGRRERSRARIRRRQRARGPRANMLFLGLLRELSLGPGFATPSSQRLIVVGGGRQKESSDIHGARAQRSAGGEKIDSSAQSNPSNSLCQFRAALRSRQRRRRRKDRRRLPLINHPRQRRRQQQTEKQRRARTRPANKVGSIRFVVGVHLLGALGGQERPLD